MNGIKYFTEIKETVIDELSYENENGIDIDDLDDKLYDVIHQTIDNMVTYTSDSKRIVNTLDYDVFEEHDVFGRPNDWSQAAFCALYDLVYDIYGTEEIIDGLREDLKIVE